MSVANIRIYFSCSDKRVPKKAVAKGKYATYLFLHRLSLTMFCACRFLDHVWL